MEEDLGIGGDGVAVNGTPYQPRRPQGTAQGFDKLKERTKTRQDSGLLEIVSQASRKAAKLVP